MVLRISFLFLSVLLLILLSGFGFANEEKTSVYQLQSTPIPANSDASQIPSKSEPLEFFVDQLSLNKYEAVISDLSKCAGNAKCLEVAKDIKGWLCIADVCQAQNANKEPVDCFEGISKNQFSSDVIQRVNTQMCQFVMTPGPNSRRALLDAIPHGDEAPDDDGGFVKAAAYMAAVRDSAGLCVKRIKKYLGPYGPKWNVGWMDAIAGCRILSGESNRIKEEKDFYVWFGVNKKFSCYGIVNPELMVACLSPTAASPKPTQEMSSVNDRRDYDSIKYLVGQLRLKLFTSKDGDLSFCDGNKKCLHDAQLIKAWRCVANVCGGKEPNKEVATCFGNDWSGLSWEMRNEIGSMMCSHVQSPEKASRMKLLDYLPGTNTNDFVEMEAYFIALKESAGSCQNYIKNYVGPYSLKWGPRWYRALSGCRLLTGVSTIEQEQRDYYTWLGVERKFSCSDIVNSEMSAVCQVLEKMDKNIFNEE